MHWSMIATLGALGLIMGLLSTQGLTRGIEPYLWIILGLFCSIVVARVGHGRWFLHGLAIGVMWGVLNGAAASVLFPQYAANNPEIMGRISAQPPPISPRIFFLLIGPVIGLASGCALGLMCWCAHYVVPAVGAATTK